jgi:DNA-binding MarR family transcriptional regulator
MLTDEDYRKLLAFRLGLRRFLRGSDEHVAAAGLTPAQHQLLLAIRGHPDPAGPSVGELATYLSLRHNGAVQLINRVERLGLLTRTRAEDADRRVVRLSLTPAGIELLAALSAVHLEELHRLAPLVDALIEPTPAPDSGTDPER